LWIQFFDAKNSRIQSKDQCAGYYCWSGNRWILIGIPGVFFALPTIAILKIIFDRVEGLKPWGILLGAEDEQTGNMAQKIRNR
jgi:hypothetical protein